MLFSNRLAAFLLMPCTSLLVFFMWYKTLFFFDHGKGNGKERVNDQSGGVTSVLYYDLNSVGLDCKSSIDPHECGVTSVIYFIKSKILFYVREEFQVSLIDIMITIS